MGLKNVWVMLPFVRSVDELVKIEKMMNEVGLFRGNDFKLYLMAEVPVIIFMAEEFAEHCDGFSIGSNDLTQLIMGADRDSDVLRQDGLLRREERGDKACHSSSDTACACQGAQRWNMRASSVRVSGLLRVPSKAGIDSISLNPDTVVRTISTVAAAEQKLILESIRKK